MAAPISTEPGLGDVRCDSGMGAHSLLPILGTTRKGLLCKDTVLTPKDSLKVAPAPASHHWPEP